MAFEFDCDGLSLLIIDDDPANLAVAAGFLERQGLEVLIAHGGAEGVERAREAQPDLILLDVMMPEMDGYETCHRLKDDEATRHIPVLFLSALNDLDDRLKGFAVGGVDYVGKPIAEAELLARVGVHLQLRRLQRELEEKNARLHSALDTGNVVNVAVGAVMVHHRLSREAAAELLRRRARSRSVKLQVVAEEVLAGLEAIHGLVE